jgi:hypothetical protein
MSRHISAYKIEMQNETTELYRVFKYYKLLKQLRLGNDLQITFVSIFLEI